MNARKFKRTLAIVASQTGSKTHLNVAMTEGDQPVKFTMMTWCGRKAPNRLRSTMRVTCEDCRAKFAALLTEDGMIRDEIKSEAI